MVATRRQAHLQQWIGRHKPITIRPGCPIPVPARSDIDFTESHDRDGHHVLFCAALFQRLLCHLLSAAVTVPDDPFHSPGSCRAGAGSAWPAHLCGRLLVYATATTDAATTGSLPIHFVSPNWLTSHATVGGRSASGLRPDAAHGTGSAPATHPASPSGQHGQPGHRATAAPTAAPTAAAGTASVSAETSPGRPNQ